LQLHQLRFAEGSPIRGPEEKKYRSVASAQCLVGGSVAKLIVRCEGRRRLPNLRSDSGRNGLFARCVVLLFSEAEETKNQ
jgi:hypothetical protein